jgi:xanthine dehydrogenase accessory factor
MIGDRVTAGQRIGWVGEAPIEASLEGLVRGLIHPSHEAYPGLKIADIDPRSEPSACFEISDKALSVGGGVLEAVLSRLNRTLSRCPVHSGACSDWRPASWWRSSGPAVNRR